MKKIIFSIFLQAFLGFNLVFGYNQSYIQKLPPRDQYKIKLIQKVNKSVVSIVWLKPTYTYTYKYIYLWEGFYIKVPDKIIPKWYQIVTAWTAFFITKNWILLTNKHVVNNPYLHYQAITSDGKKYNIKILAISKKYDLALVYIPWIKSTPLK